MDKLQEELEAHPLVEKVEKKADKKGEGHESPHNLKVLGIPIGTGGAGP